MNPLVAQIVLTVIFLTAAIVFVILDAQSLAIGLVGAVLGQGVSVGVRAAVNNH